MTDFAPYETFWLFPLQLTDMRGHDVRYTFNKYRPQQKESQKFKTCMYIFTNSLIVIFQMSSTTIDDGKKIYKKNNQMNNFKLIVLAA